MLEHFTCSRESFKQQCLGPTLSQYRGGRFQNPTPYLYAVAHGDAPLLHVGDEEARAVLLAALQVEAVRLPLAAGEGQHSGEDQVGDLILVLLPWYC